jgi:hypothetical protein
MQLALQLTNEVAETFELELPPIVFMKTKGEFRV